MTKELCTTKVAYKTKAVGLRLAYPQPPGVRDEKDFLLLRAAVLAFFLSSAYNKYSQNDIFLQIWNPNIRNVSLGLSIVASGKREGGDSTNLRPTG